MKETIIAPSVLSLDYSNTAGALEELAKSRAKWLHFDVMDGHFVPNLTFGPDILKGFQKGSNLLLDVHLMIEEPENFLDPFIKAGADLITFHTEALDNDISACTALLKTIKEKGTMAGFSVKPGTPIEDFEALLPESDLVLVMSVEPGFGGQSFMEEQLDKVRWLKDRQDKYGYKIEIDGGINDKTALKAKEAGADVLVAGSYVFGKDIVEAVESLI